MAEQRSDAASGVPSSGDAAPAEAVWELVVTAEVGEALARSRLMERIRPSLERRMRERPGEASFSWKTPLGTVHARRRSGGGPDAALRLAFAPDAAALGTRSSSATAPEAALPSLRLPDDETRRLGETLIGLDAIGGDILLRWRCQWDGGLARWEARTGYSLPVPLRERMHRSCALLIFEGDPGLGKSALARAVCDAYCREAGIAGTLLMATTKVRGNGVVGDFSKQLWDAFAALAALPSEEFGCLLVDEADAVAMARGERQAHQEDRAASSTILQALDAMCGMPRRAVIMATNRLAAVDAAVLRRGTICSFARPDAAARRTLLAPWLPHLAGRELERAVRRTCGLTPADIERALCQAWLAALAQDKPPAFAQVEESLRRAERTGSV